MTLKIQNAIRQQVTSPRLYLSNPGRWLAGAVCSAGLFTSFGPTIVQAAQGSAGFALEEVVVTARKREESLQDTPISITAFTATELDDRQLSSIHQISESTPNLVFDPISALSGSSAASAASIRGVGQLDFTLNTDPGVGMYVDGVYLTRSIGALVSLLDIERIEVLRGPQGTLFGRNTIGGAINITTKKPNENYEGRLDLNIGSFNQRDGTVVFNAPITDNLFSRTSLSMRNRDGYMERADGQEIADVDSQAARIALRWLPSEDLEIDIAADVTKDRQGSAPLTLLDADENAFFPFVHNTFVVPGGACATPPSPINNPQCYNDQYVPSDEYDSFSGMDSKSDLDLWGVSASVAWDLDAITLKSITAYREFTSNSNLDLDISPLPIFDIEVAQDVEIFSQEFQLLGTAFDEKLNWITGLYYVSEDGRHIETINASFFGLQSGGDVENESFAVFAQATYDLTPALSLTLGVRYTDDKREFTPDTFYFRGSPAPFGPPAGLEILPQRPFDNNADDVNPMLNLNFAWTDNLNVYFTYSEGFKSGGFTQRLSSPQAEPPSFQPEFVELYEVGAKYTGLDNRLRLNMALFHSDYSDIQVLGTNPNTVGASTINAGEAEIDGFEIDMTYLPLEALLIQAGIGYLDGDYISLGAGVSDILESDPLPKSPQWTLSSSLAYTINMNDKFDLTSRIDWSYRSEVSNTATPEGDPLAFQGAYHLVNASIMLKTTDDKWKLVLSGKNLGDERYNYNGGGLDANFGSADAIFALPRTWALKLIYNWY